MHDNNAAGPSPSWRSLSLSCRRISETDQQTHQHVGQVLNRKILEITQQGRPCVTALMSTSAQRLHSSSCGRSGLLALSVSTAAATATASPFILLASPCGSERGALWKGCDVMKVDFSRGGCSSSVASGLGWKERTVHSVLLCMTFLTHVGGEVAQKPCDLSPK